MNNIRKLVALFVSWCYSLVFLCAQTDSLPIIAPIVTDSVVKSDTGTKLKYVAGIAVYGNVKTKPFIVEREFSFKQGDYVPAAELPGKLEFARQQLINTGLFIQVEVRIENQFEDIVFITVLVKERWYIFPVPYFKLIDRNFNEWWVTQNASLKRVNYGAKIIHNNFSGRNDKFNLWLITGYNRQISLRYERPFAFKSLKFGYNIFINFNKQKELNYGSTNSKQLFYNNPDDFVRQNMRIQADITYRPAILTRHIFRVAYVTENISDSILIRNPNFLPGGLGKVQFPEISYTIRHYNTDYNIYPLKGFQIEASLTRQGGFKGPVDATTLRVISSYTQPVSPKAQIQYQYGGVLRVPFNQPFYMNQLFGYGSIFMRGLEYYVIDGVAGSVGRVTGRHRLMQFIVPLPTSTKNKRKFEVPIMLMGKVYGDAGYAYDKNAGSSILNNKFLYSGGAGIDIVAAYDMAFRLEYSFNQFGESGFFFHARKDF